MESIENHQQLQTRRCLFSLMISSEKKAEFVKIISMPSELLKLTIMLVSDLDLFVNMIRNKSGSKRVQRMLGISYHINRFLSYPILTRFTEIMTHGYSSDVALRLLQVSDDTIQKSVFCTTAIQQTLVLAHDNIGSSTLKKVITLAQDRFKNYFLEIVAANAFSLNQDITGNSVILHVLELDVTHKTTLDTPRLHHVANEFIRVLPNDIAELHKLCSELTSDLDLFVDFVKTRRGSLSVQIALGNSEEIDKIFLEAIEDRFTDIITDRFGVHIVSQILRVFKKRGNSKVYGRILRDIGINALSLTRNPRGNSIVKGAIDAHDPDCTVLMAFKLHSHYVKLSFEGLGSNVVEKLLSVGESVFALVLIVEEFVACDEYTMVRLAKSEYGNKVLKKTLEFAKERRVDLFGDLVEKLKPLLTLLRGSQGENIAAIIDR